MPIAQSIATRVPQRGDTPEALLARGFYPYLEGVALARAARNTSTSSATIESLGFRGILIDVYMWTTGGAGGVLPVLSAPNSFSASWAQFAVLDSGYVQANNTGWHYQFGPGYLLYSAGGGGGGLTGGRLPPRFRITMAHSSANPYDYAVNYTLLD